MVGSRKTTQYGRNTAVEISSRIASHGITVVSGMAMGIDTCAHIGALKAAGLSACVKNAPQEVKDCCDMVLSDCMDGAVAEFIERVQKII